MRPRLIMTIALTVLLLVSSLSIMVSGSDAAEDGEESSFLREISGNILSGIDAVTDAVSKRTDNTVLPGVARL